MQRTWVDLGFYAIDNAIPIITALGALVAAAGTVATTILGVLNRTHLARQDIAIETVRQDVNSTTSPQEIAAAILATPIDPKP